MAIFHCSVKTISRSAGRSAVAAIAYRAGERIQDERLLQDHDYTRRTGVEHTEIFLPAESPKWAYDRSKLWNEIEKTEKRKNSTVAREFEVGLPHELDAIGRRQLVSQYCQMLIERHGMAVDAAIHAPGKGGDQRNYHAHILCSTRRLTSDGFSEKTRELDQRQSGQVKHWREQWANVVNTHLEKEGKNIKVDHRSLKDQGVDREPTVHLGVAATQMARRGIETDRGLINQLIAEERSSEAYPEIYKELQGVGEEKKKEGPLFKERKSMDGVDPSVENSQTMSPLKPAKEESATSDKAVIQQFESQLERQLERAEAEWKEIVEFLFYKHIEKEVFFPSSQIEALRKYVEDESIIKYPKKYKKLLKLRKAVNQELSPREHENALLEHVEAKWKDIINTECKEIVFAAQREMEALKKELQKHKKGEPNKFLNPFNFKKKHEEWFNKQKELTDKERALQGMIGEKEKYTSGSIFEEYPPQSRQLAERNCREAHPELYEKLKELREKKNKETLLSRLERAKAEWKGFVDTVPTSVSRHPIEYEKLQELEKAVNQELSLGEHYKAKWDNAVDTECEKIVAAAQKEIEELNKKLDEIEKELQKHNQRKPTKSYLFKYKEWVEKQKELTDKKHALHGKIGEKEKYTRGSILKGYSPEIQQLATKISYGANPELHEKLKELRGVSPCWENFQMSKDQLDLMIQISILYKQIKILSSDIDSKIEEIKGVREKRDKQNLNKKIKKKIKEHKKLKDQMDKLGEDYRKDLLYSIEQPENRPTYAEWKGVVDKVSKAIYDAGEKETEKVVMKLDEIEKKLKEHNQKKPPFPFGFGKDSKDSREWKDNQKHLLKEQKNIRNRVNELYENVYSNSACYEIAELTPYFISPETYGEYYEKKEKEKQQGDEFEKGLGRQPGDEFEKGLGRQPGDEFEVPQGDENEIPLIPFDQYDWGEPMGDGFKVLPEVKPEEKEKKVPLEKGPDLPPPVKPKTKGIGGLER